RDFQRYRHAETLAHFRCEAKTGLYNLNNPPERKSTRLEMKAMKMKTALNELSYSRTPAAWFFTAGLLLASAVNALAEVHYVDLNTTTAPPPYPPGATAATNIQDAVDAAVAGDEIVVTNGIYLWDVRRGDNTVKVDKPMTVRSVNGPFFTII